MANYPQGKFLGQQIRAGAEVLTDPNSRANLAYFGEVSLASRHQFVATARVASGDLIRTTVRAYTASIAPAAAPVFAVSSICVGSGFYFSSVVSVDISAGSWGCMWELVKRA
jgi:hypothetical protein